MKLDDNAVATLAKVSDLIEQWHEEALDRYAWEVKCHQRDEDMRVLIMARAVREQLEQCVTEMRAIVGWPCNGDGDVTGWELRMKVEQCTDGTWSRPPA
jgi:hypothetical protein